MQKEQIILAALASSEREEYTPVQVQKILFLIDKELSAFLDIHFNFIPYSYGPFDINIYYVLNKLEQDGDVDTLRIPQISWPKYRLTAQGQAKGQEILEQLDKKVSDYIKQLSAFVRSLSFSELISVIYKEYPEMKINSIFKN